MFSVLLSTIIVLIIDTMEGGGRTLRIRPGDTPDDRSDSATNDAHDRSPAAH